MMGRTIAATLCVAMMLGAGPASAEEMQDDLLRQDGDESGESAGSDEAPPTSGGEPSDPEQSVYQELKTVESQVDELKEKVFRSKARLLLLEEKVIRGVVSGAKAVIRHINRLGNSFQLESVTYYFDGNPIYQKTNVGTEGALAKTKKEQIFEANVPPGNHTLSVSGVIQGRGQGVFAYLSDYSFQFSSSYSFIARDGKTARLDAILYRKGGALAEWTEAPDVEFKMLSDGGATPAAGQEGQTDGGS